MFAGDVFFMAKNYDTFITDRISHIAGDSLIMNILKTHTEAYACAAVLQLMRFYITSTCFSLLSAFW